MQRPAPASDPATVDPTTDARCPVCGEPVRGIAAARPGEHRFVGCDHYASARFLQPGVEGPSASATPPRIGP